MIETEKRSECWFSSTRKWHKTIPFLLLLLFFHFSFFSMFCLKLWLFLFHCTYILHTHLHSMSFLVFICSFYHLYLPVAFAYAYLEGTISFRRNCSLGLCVCILHFFGFLLTLKLHSFLLLAHFALTYNFHFNVPLFITQGKFETNKSHRNVYGDKWPDHSKGVMANVNFIWIV